MPHNALDWIDDVLEQLSADGLRRVAAERQGSQRAAGIDFEGNRFVNFGSNDYLGLAAELLNEAVHTAIDAVGWGSGASPLVTGRGALHARLERELAQFEDTESALLFPTGFAANLGTIVALAGRGDVIFSDARNHASIIDGCRLSGATIQLYPHRDVDGLSRRMRRATGFRRSLIITDSLFSMDGDLAPLPELAELAERHDAMLMVDEAHATGVFGKQGRGVCEHLAVEDGVHVRVGTLSKALGSIGGFVCGPQRLIDWLFNRARPYVFSTAPPEPAAAAAIAALQIVRNEPQRRLVLLERSARLRESLVAQGWFTGNSASQIIPVIIGAPQPTMQIATLLRERGLFVPGIRPPSVPKGQSLLRISLSYDHTDQHISELLDALQDRSAGAQHRC